MRKKFIRLAIVAIVVLVAFLMYRSTEGFIQTQDTKCAFNKTGALIGDKTVYTCSIDTATFNRKQNEARVCANNFVAEGTGWEACNVGNNSKYLINPSANRMCYKCVPAPASAPPSAPASARPTPQRRAQTQRRR